MVIEKISKQKITVSFSGVVGKKGLRQIKKYIEVMETQGAPVKKTRQHVIDALSREINGKAWEKLKKKRGLVLE